MNDKTLVLVPKGTSTIKKDYWPLPVKVEQDELPLTFKITYWAGDECSGHDDYEGETFPSEEAAEEFLTQNLGKLYAMTRGNFDIKKEQNYVDGHGNPRVAEDLTWGDLEEDLRWQISHNTLGRFKERLASVLRKLNGLKLKGLKLSGFEAYWIKQKELWLQGHDEVTMNSRTSGGLVLDSGMLYTNANITALYANTWAEMALGMDEREEDSWLPAYGSLAEIRGIGLTSQ